MKYTRTSLSEGNLNSQCYLLRMALQLVEIVCMSNESVVHSSSCFWRGEKLPKEL